MVDEAPHGKDREQEADPDQRSDAHVAPAVGVIRCSKRRVHELSRGGRGWPTWRGDLDCLAGEGAAAAGAAGELIYGQRSRQVERKLQAQKQRVKQCGNGLITERDAIRRHDDGDKMTQNNRSYISSATGIWQS